LLHYLVKVETLKNVILQWVPKKIASNVSYSFIDMDL